MIDLTGHTFGWWTVQAFSGRTPQGVSTWRCQCQCGTIKETVFYTSLTTGASQSCGCLRALKLSQRHKTRQRGGKASTTTTP